MKKILNKQSSYINQGKLKELEKDNQKRNQKRIPKEADRKRKPHIRNAIDKGQK